MNKSIQRLAAKGVFAESQGHFALDGSDLETTARYREVGMKTVTEKHWSRKEKKVVEIEKVVYGFKLLALYDVHLRLVVAVKVAQIQEHDSLFTRALLQQGMANLGEGLIRVLLDRPGLPGWLDLVADQARRPDRFRGSRQDQYARHCRCPRFPETATGR